MKINIVLKSFGYIIIFCCCFIVAKYNFNIDIKTLWLLLISLPASMLFSNIIHELGHFVFCKAFNLHITRIDIGFFRYENSQKTISLKGTCFLSGKCAFMITDDLKPVKYFLVFMGGVIFNIVSIIVTLILLYMGINSIFIYSITVCCILNILANGIYSKSADRRLLKEYIQKV